MSKRALRRFVYQKRKKSVLKNFNWLHDDSKRIGVLANTPKVCSCFMCGNPRKFWKKITLQEEKSIIKEREGILEYNLYGLGY